MAATDQTFRSQRGLDIVFGVSCLLMLASVVWMFAQDYFREFKVEQRDFRDVETALAERGMLDLVPDDAQLLKIEEATKNLEEKIQARNESGNTLITTTDGKQRKLRDEMQRTLTDKVSKEADVQGIKAVYDSEMSLYNIAVENRNVETPGTSAYESLDRHVQDKKQVVESLGTKLAAANLALDTVTREYKNLQSQEKEAITAASQAEDEWKRLTADFDRFAKLTAQKKWKTGDWVRALPVLDAFASPIRIQQYTLDQLPIDYSFKYVTRYDRCTTCHQGIDQPRFSREALQALKEDPTEEQRKKLDNARAMLKSTRTTLKQLEWSFDISDLPNLRRLSLTDARVSEFAAHPRLDLFVHANSPHGAEKFGCTICHSGQGSATDFINATHSPDNPHQREHWIHEKAWGPIHFWDYPMLPKRFIESSCLKCHYNVVDLLPDGDRIEIRAGKKVESPGAKVVRGYNIVRELGCFGCHEIAGIKDNRWVGPDLRLEPSPPLEDMTPEQRVKALADPFNPPGTMRKVGPSLRRLSEKTNEEWVRKWIDNPRGFRPDTKMPHFFHLSNNNDDALKGTGQEQFPAATIHAMAYYLFRQSEAYIAQAGKLPEPKLPADYNKDKARGRMLFTERGCLACHAHEGTTRPGDNLPPVVSEAHFGPNLSRLAAKLGVKPGDTASARNWLIQWIKDPKQYHPRTFMPVTHLTDADAADLAAWLLSQSSDWKADDVPDAKDAYASVAKVFLGKVMSRLDVDDMFPDNKPSAEKLQAAIDDSDKKITEKLDAEGKLKFYLGKKSINQSGCFACHDIPGFETAKPIGTPLNDWGKKDAERLAFEDVKAYVERHYEGNVVDSLLDSETGKGQSSKDGREPFEKFFLEGLGHQHSSRNSFLYAKLREPRSFDYDRLKSWDDRLRMPQFRFTRGIAQPLEGETPEQAQNREEAESREAVMTFILGLVAEPVPLSHVYQPPTERMAEVQGKKVIDKFNCAGCHLIRPGVYDFNSAPRLVDGEKRHVILEELVSSHRRVINSNSYKSDHEFKDHNAWVGQLSPDPNRLSVRGLPFGKEDGETVRVRLTQAVRFNKPEDADLKPDEREKRALDIPAAEALGLPVSELLFQTAPLGGTLTDLLAAYLLARKLPELPDEAAVRSTLPPPLLREGERVQPAWLFQFLKDPQVIRPEQRMRLRMPRFNLSDDEARALVNYFAAVDKTTNVGIGLQYPYSSIPQRDEGYFKPHTTQYLTRLKEKNALASRQAQLGPIWKKLLPEQVGQLEEKIKQAKSAADKAAPNSVERKAAEAELGRLQAQLKGIQDLKTQPAEWEKDKAYLTDAYRLVVNNNICLACHEVGQWGKQPPMGPRLDNINERMRPDWILRWIASPERLLIYPIGNEPMPKNFPKDKSDFQDSFVGTPFEQVTAVRDVLMVLPKAAAMPEDQYFRPPEGTLLPGETK